MSKEIKEIENEDQIEIVAKNDDTHRSLFDQIDDIGQVDQVVFFHFDHAQAAWRIRVEQRLDQR